MPETFVIVGANLAGEWLLWPASRRPSREKVRVGYALGKRRRPPGRHNGPLGTAGRLFHACPKGERRPSG
jgi:hypothetical protein